MIKSLFTSLICLFIAMLFVGTQCNRDYYEEPQYEFIEAINLFPEKKSYNVGDTIWLEYVNPDKKFFDDRSKKLIAADSISISFTVGLGTMYNTPINPAGGFCDYIIPLGINVNRLQVDRGTSISFNLGCNASYNFKIGAILRQKGIYSLGFGFANLNTCPDRISGFPYSTISYRFDVADANKDVYLSIPRASRGESVKGFTEGRIDQKILYILEVK